MSGFRIAYRYSAGNLHLNPEGSFTQMSAWILIKTIKQHYRGFGRIFVDTAGLKEISPSGTGLFKNLMTSSIVPLDRLYLKGEKGFQIGPDGSRVLICNPERTRKIRRRGSFWPVLCAGKQKAPGSEKPRFE